MSRPDTASSTASRQSWVRDLLDGWKAEEGEGEDEVLAQAAKLKDHREQLHREQRAQLRKKREQQRWDKLQQRLYADPSSEGSGDADADADADAGAGAGADHTAAAAEAALERMAGQRVVAQRPSRRGPSREETRRREMEEKHAAPGTSMFKSQSVISSLRGETVGGGVQRTSTHTRMERRYMPATAVASASARDKDDNGDERAECAPVLLTELDHESMRTMAQVWQERLREKAATRERKEQLVRDWEARRLKKAEGAEGAGVTAAAAAAAAEADAQREVEEGRARRPEAGAYGAADVWVEELPPSPPSMGVEKAECVKTKTTLEMLGLAEEDGIASSESESESSDSDDEEYKGLSKTEQLRLQRQKESKYPEDVDLEHFFLHPPKQRTVRLPKSFKPVSLVAWEDLPNPKRQRPKRRTAVCVCFRASGLELTKSNRLGPEDAAGVLRTVLHFIGWVRFTVVKYEAGLELRSTRTLDASDCCIYLTRRIPQAPGRLRVGVYVWLKRKDVKRAATALAVAADSRRFVALLAANCPGIARANVGNALPRPPRALLLKDEPEEARQAPESKSDPALTQQEHLDLAELDKYSVLSPRSSAALWDLTVRIEAGLEITTDVLQSAQADLDKRAHDFRLTNLVFEHSRKHALSSFDSAKSDIGAWRSNLNHALLLRPGEPE